MAGEQNVETAKRAYAAFSAGDAEGAMASMADEIEWVTPGNSAVSGTARGKARWERSGPSSPRRALRPRRSTGSPTTSAWLCHTSMGGDEADTADVLTFRDGKLVKFQSAADTASLERHFGTK